MRMNIQPIFIFDGPSRPWKRGGVAGRIDWKKIDLLRKMLNHLKIPHHRAPAEAEAECARLNELGIVDAVWTDDGDAFMFGAKVLIKEHREGKSGKKSDNLVRVHRADEIERKHRINRQGLVLFALLSGGDYDTKGLPGCGPTAALAAAQFDNGRLGKILCETPLRQLHCFTESLREYFQISSTKGVYVPPGYPRDLHVKNYREPKVATFEQAHSLRGLKDGWYVPIDEDKLRKFLLPMFNMDTKAYLKHILPLLLVRELINTTPDTVEKNLVFDLQLVHKRGRDHDTECLERQVTFDPKKCTELNLWKKPDTEDWKEDFDPTAPVEAELLEYILVNALGQTELQRLKQLASQPKPKKRKNNDAAVEETGRGGFKETADIGSEPAAKRQKRVPASEAIEDGSARTSKTTTKTTSKPKSRNKNSTTIQPAEAPTPPVRKSFQLPRALVRNPSMLSEFASRSSQDVLSRSTSFQSFDSVGESSRGHSTPRDVSASQDVGDKRMISQDMAYENNCQTRSISHRAMPSPNLGDYDQAPPSSQLNPAAQSWTFENLLPSSTLSPGSTPKRAPAMTSDTQAALRMWLPASNEETTSSAMTPALTPTQCSTGPSGQLPLPQTSKSRRGCVVVDLDSEDEDADIPPASARATIARRAPVAMSALPAQMPQVAHTPTPPSQILPAPVSASLDSRQAIAAARLKHFEKQVHETIDLTLDD